MGWQATEEPLGAAPAARLVELVRDPNHPEFSTKVLKDLKMAKHVKSLRRRYRPLDLPAWTKGKQASKLLAAIRQQGL